MEQEKKKKYSNIFYGIIGIATLMIATIGATFAYYTASATNNGTIVGNMATVTFNLSVTKVTNADDTKGGLIPMSNNMLEQAVSNASTKGICVDDNGNASCQIYKITVVNTGTSSMFVDGYVTLSGGSGTPADYTATTANKTSMRWAQVFCNTESGGLVTTSCTTAGNSTVRPDTGSIAFTALGGSTTQSTGLNTEEIKTARNDVTNTTTTIKSNTYEVINRNYIRVSDHVANNYSYTRANDTTSALVYSQYLDPSDGNASNNTGTSNSTFTDSQVYYIVVWLSENGHNQTVGATNDASHGGNASTTANNFFNGNVTFISAQGSEVTATFFGHTRVTPTY